MKLKSLFLFGILWLLTQMGYSQTTLETFAATEEMVVESWFFKPLTDDYKFSIFSLNDVVVDYETEGSEFVSYTILGYDVWKGFGPVVGGRIFDGRASALAGIQWVKAGEQLLISTNITTELRDNPFYEFYLLAQYRFPISKKLNFFSQFQNSTNFNNDAHSLSFQRTRVGLSLQKLQFGLGINTYQFGEEGDFESDPGLFVRLEF
ncbi:MAG: hypothetical protein ACFB0B_08845 [Thermonemataceae bacterium]